MTQKQMKEHREDSNKHQSETNHYKKRDKWIKEDNTNFFKGIE
jgi:hypothetical protein